MNNSDERDYAEEASNAALMAEALIAEALMVYTCPLCEEVKHTAESFITHGREIHAEDWTNGLPDYSETGSMTTEERDAHRMKWTGGYYDAH